MALLFSDSPALSLPYIVGIGAAGVAFGWWLHGRKDAPGLRPKRIALTYFESKFYGEPIRMALFVGGIPFDDIRIKGNAEGYAQVAEMRASGKLEPFGQVPLLEVDGVSYTQSSALLRWAGSLSNLYPESAAGRLRCDMVEAALQDIKEALRPQWYGHIMGRSPMTGKPRVGG
jgi:glutathione S-transferase